MKKALNIKVCKNRYLLIMQATNYVNDFITYKLKNH